MIYKHTSIVNEKSKLQNVSISRNISVNKKKLSVYLHVNNVYLSVIGLRMIKKFLS